MKVGTKVTFYDEQGEKFFGEGPARLMRGVEKTGSLLQAAKSMEMAYSKAVRLMQNAEKALGFPLLIRTTGGASGGGSRLTEEGRAWLLRYEAYRDACISANEALFRQYFPAFSSGCVIMASGLGTRFGGNKLMADFCGKPLISCCLAATEGLFAARIPVTRNPETAEYLKTQGFSPVLHDFPGRNDTVRLGLTKIQETETAGCLFVQADQPLLKKYTIKKLLAAAEKEPDRIWRVSADGVPGSPVWFPKSLYPELLALPEGKGGGMLIRKYPERVGTVPAEDACELMDVDTPEDLFKAAELFQPLCS